MERGSRTRSWPLQTRSVYTDALLVSSSSVLVVFTKLNHFPAWIKWPFAIEVPGYSDNVINTLFHL
jgi:hypothetical protein